VYILSGEPGPALLAARYAARWSLQKARRAAVHLFLSKSYSTEIASPSMTDEGDQREAEYDGGPEEPQSQHHGSISGHEESYDDQDSLHHFAHVRPSSTQ
jgi:hypothetical protein